jgi:hypothetical protein
LSSTSRMSGGDDWADAVLLLRIFISPSSAR